MKGIVGDLGEMKIPLKPDVRQIKQHPYTLNLLYKEKVKVELEHMMEEGTIEPIEE